jgi:NAD(P)-dependent dehydrogenase (short-subunit alcohol dehydrogenase family)
MNTHTPSEVVVVTGASAGIGQGAALEIAKRGFGVVATYHSHPEGADQTVTLIQSPCLSTSDAATASTTSRVS